MPAVMKYFNNMFITKSIRGSKKNKKQNNNNNKKEHEIIYLLTKSRIGIINSDFDSACKEYLNMIATILTCPH